MTAIDGTVTTAARIVRDRGYACTRFTLVTDECEQVTIKVRGQATPEYVRELKDFARAAARGARVVAEGALCWVSSYRGGDRETVIDCVAVPVVVAAAPGAGVLVS